jgi:hypothetical protein
MREALALLGGALGLAAVWGTPASAAAVRVRFEFLAVSDVLALGLVPLDIAGFAGSHLTFVFDLDTGAGELIDARVHVEGPITSGSLLTLDLLPGDVDLLQIDAGTAYEYEDDSVPPLLIPEMAENPRGTLDGASFTFDRQALLHAEGAPDAGIASCSGDLCDIAFPPLPIPLDGPLAPLDLGPPAVTLTIENLVLGQTATLTGPFALAVGANEVSFTIDSAAGTVVPEPAQALLTVAGVGALAILRRRRG